MSLMNWIPIGDGDNANYDCMPNVALECVRVIVLYVCILS